MNRSASLDIEALKMMQEQYTLSAQPSGLPSPDLTAIHPVGIYGWRKRCLYFFVLLLVVIMIVNLALTIWILKVMSFTIDGMGSLKVSGDGVRLEGVAEFLLPLYAREIGSREDSALLLHSDRNVTLNARDHRGLLTGQLTVGPQAVEVHTQRFEVWSHDTRRLLFSAEDDEVQIGTEKLRVTGVEGAVFQHSVETPHIRAEPSHDLRLESPTRTLTMEAPRGVEISADAGDLRATCRKDLQLESTEGEIFLNAHVIRLGSLPIGTTAAAHGSTVPKQTVYELCACPNGRLYLSPAELESTCQATSNVCLWS
ncbi:zeta-sarcoglycan-like [Scleropages formosus]|uniref:Sarcoglycan zeta n=1 Tax=Scleropages formosus TaxID=113540 RepID=A0A8C9RU45_SCLFO|nr:zeta-sarcoglycan-like [Scleropages formosus]